MRSVQLGLFLTLLATMGLVQGCGSDEEARLPVVAGETPEETWRLLRAAALSGDWGTSYDLIAPSVRQQAENAWGRALTDPAVGLRNCQYLAFVLADETPICRVFGGSEEAGDTGAKTDPPDPVSASMSLREAYVAFMEHEAKFDPDSYSKIDKSSLDVSRSDDGTVMAWIVSGARRPMFPLIRERGRWYMKEDLPHTMSWLVAEWPLVPGDPLQEPPPQAEPTDADR